jgi:glycosyltransferase involved in cell wall biosynthesis
MSKRIIIRKQLQQYVPLSDEDVVVDMANVKQWVKQRTIFRHLWQYREARGVTYHVDTLLNPLDFALLLRMLSHGRCYISDQAGHVIPVTWGYIAALVGSQLGDYADRPTFLRQVQSELSQLLLPEQGPQKVTLILANRPVYLRTDHLFGLQSGGSVGHVAGVLNHLDTFSGKPLLITTDRIPTVRPDIEWQQIWPENRFRGQKELHYLAFNSPFYQKSLAYVHGQSPSFIYQRYSTYNYAGLRLARTFRVPFVLEYNGSEIWINRHWGTPLHYESIAEQVEMANLKGAHLVVVVSQPMKDELVARGVDEAKILVNPNGVDPERYSPEVDGSVIRTKYGFADKVVIGFIGTFGPWHGAEVLAEAFGRLLTAYPAYQDKVRLLMIGDGATMTKVKENLTRYHVSEYTVLTGLIPQEEGPKHLAACDILASPHVPNPDGTPFFGSPTKLFEYMAMGKGIVASDLDQIGQVLNHRDTAWMVKPGDAEALMAGLKILIDEPTLRTELGTNARAEAVANYTWRSHTERIIAKLIELCQ